MNGKKKEEGYNAAEWLEKMQKTVADATEVCKRLIEIDEMIKSLEKEKKEARKKYIDITRYLSRGIEQIYVDDDSEFDYFGKKGIFEETVLESLKDRDIINAEFSNGERNQTHVLLGMVRSKKEGMTLDEIIALAVADGDTEAHVRDMVRKLVNNASLYITSGDRYKVVRDPFIDALNTWHTLR